QTPIVAGLRLYQWIAVLGLVAGAVLTAIPGVATTTSVHFGLPMVLAAVALGLLSLFLTGVDFPESNKRFSRLA
ncbi:MAG: diacylglyceryl transferase, partial [Chlorobi bacterium]|nr:diacylglyceryl transferase [Chlorobiota bacterium]